MSILASFILLTGLTFSQTDTIPPPPPPPPPPYITTKRVNKSPTSETNTNNVAPPPPPPPLNIDEPWSIVAQMPHFSGCEDIADYIDRKQCADQKMMEFIYSELKYPAEAMEKNIEGTIVISFIVDEDGNLTEFILRKKIGGGCDEEAMRVMEKMAALPNKWVAGYHQNGEAVKVRYNLPVRFKMR